MVCSQASENGQCESEDAKREFRMDTDANAHGQRLEDGTADGGVVAEHPDGGGEPQDGEGAAPGSRLPECRRERKRQAEEAAVEIEERGVAGSMELGEIEDVPVVGGDQGRECLP